MTFASRLRRQSVPAPLLAGRAITSALSLPSTHCYGPSRTIGSTCRPPPFTSACERGMRSSVALPPVAAVPLHMLGSLAHPPEPHLTLLATFASCCRRCLLGPRACVCRGPSSVASDPTSRTCESERRF